MTRFRADPLSNWIRSHRHSGLVIEPGAGSVGVRSLQKGLQRCSQPDHIVPACAVANDSHIFIQIKLSVFMAESEPAADLRNKLKITPGGTKLK